MKLTYTNVNGYLIPNFTYKSGEQMVQLDKYGSCQSACHYVASCTVKWMNDRLQTFFKDAGLDGKAGWQLFKEKEDLGKLDNQKEVENYCNSIFFGLNESRKKNQN